MESRWEYETSIKLEPSWISNASTEALEVCLLSGSSPSVLPTMLGGSAPSQTSGAPFRTESASRNSVWSPTVQQNSLFSSSCGVYSLFPGPGDNVKTLYSPTAKTSNSKDPFQDCVGTKKLSETFFPEKFSFGTSATPKFNRTVFEREIEPLILTPKNFHTEVKPYSLAKKERSVKTGNPKRFLGDFVFIKSEVSDESKVQSEKSEWQRDEKDRKRNQDEGNFTHKESAVGSDEVFADEPDSTEFKISSEPQTSESVTTSEAERLEKELMTYRNEVESCNSDVCLYNNEIELKKEKCSIKVIDLSTENSKRQKKSDKSAKVELITETGNRGKKFVKAKTPDSSFKKPSPELFKPSPTRTLSLPPHNGGCSRTTPVTFKNTSQPEMDLKPQNLNVEIPPLIIKKEPSDFHRYSNGAPFLSPGLDFFSPGGILDKQLLSPIPYPDPFESSSRRKDGFLSLNVDQNFMSPSQSFLTPRSESFLSPNTDIPSFGAFRNYQPPKIDENYLLREPEIFLGRPKYLPHLGNRSQDNGVFISSTTESEIKNLSESTSNVTPCQVAEVTSASSLLSPKQPNPNHLMVKQETGSGNSSLALSAIVEPSDSLKEVGLLPSGQSATVSSTVGVAPMRQRCQERSNDIRISSDHAPPPPAAHGDPCSPTSMNLPNAMGATVYSAGMMDNQSANLITTWPTQPHNPTLWKYSGPIDYPPFPPVGFQLVRDPVTGHFLLIPASNIEALQRAILWPNYQPTPPHMIIPPISVQPTAQHLLLDTNIPSVDFLAPETIHPNASHPRILIPTDNVSKRKMATPTVIKLESSECSNTAVVTSCDKNNFVKTQTTTLNSRKDTVFHPSSASASSETKKRSQATSPVVESQPKNSETANTLSDYCQFQPFTTVTLQDASNQTDDMDFETGTDRFTSNDKFVPYTKKTEQHIKMPTKKDVATETASADEPEDDKRMILKAISKKKSEKSLKINVPDNLNIKKEIVSPRQVDVSGLELLSNSIERYMCESECNEACEEDERKDLSNDACEGAVLLQNLKNGFREIENGFQENSKHFGGLGLLCALAEQRFQEEIGDERNNVELKKETDEEEKDKNSKMDDMNNSESEDLPKLTEETEEVQNKSETPKRGPGRPRKKKSEEPPKRMSKEMSPPILEKETDFCYDDGNDLDCDSELSNSCKDTLKPPTLIPSMILDPVIESEITNNNTNSETTMDTDTKKRKLSETEYVSSSKKRKVGRPRKNQQDQKKVMETIVAKKPKLKPVLIDDGCIKKVEVNEKVCDDPEGKKARKIRPKLKAEAKMREWIPDNEDSDREACVKDETVNENDAAESSLPNCVLTTEDLQSDKFPIRTLTAMGGLFYAGQLSAIRAPDVYGITIDGERGNRPHIYSREEILKDSILEVKPENATVLVTGVRCCAYWSDQYRCLYPGTVSTGSPDPEHDDKFINVEFDDGDSGRINIEDIRLLPKDYPIVVYDPNPLQSLSKRKRRISGASVESHSKERKSNDSIPNAEKNDNVTEKTPEPGNEETEAKKLTQFPETGFLEESERKHLKKKRREKLKRLQSLTKEGIKKHRKHRCSDEHRHHRHHKKHRKHKHKHGKRRCETKRDEEGTKDELKVTKKKNKASSEKKPKKCKKRTDSIESRSKMAAFLPARQLWGWSGKGHRRPGAKGRARKEFYKTIQRGKERISIGDCAVFLSTGRPDRPYIGRIESMWESWGTNMIVRVKWFYHPEETVGCPASLEYPGALFESPHVDENDVQTISHKCEVLPLKEYIAKIGDDPHKFDAIYDNNDIYYLAGYYDPTNTTLKMEPGVK